MIIRNNRDLRCAYELLMIWHELVDEAKAQHTEELMEKIKNTQELKRGSEWIEMLTIDYETFQKKIDRANERIRQLKQDIRTYNNRKQDDRYAIHNDYDGYIEVVPFPTDWTRNDVEEYFNEYERMECPNSPYDCTGELFTAWHSIVRRAGRWYLYHCVRIDV